MAPPYSLPTPTVCPSQHPLAQCNLLSYQSLPTSIPFRQATSRRRKDESCVGTASRGIVRFPRILWSNLKPLISWTLLGHESGDKTSSKRCRATGSHGTSRSPHRRPLGLPRNPLECGTGCTITASHPPVSTKVFMPLSCHRGRCHAVPRRRVCPFAPDR